MHKEKKWFTFVAEACVIIVSILLAFGIDAWWDNRKEDSREDAYLVSLRENVVRTIQDNNRVIAEQSQEQALTVNVAQKIRSGADLPVDYRTTFPTVTLPAESMDAYRDLLASGGTTLIASPQVRSTMENLLQRVEYNEVAERWALETINSARMIILSNEPGSMSREHLADIWSVYIDVGARLIDGKNRLDKVAQEALLALDEAIGAKD